MTAASLSSRDLLMEWETIGNEWPRYFPAIAPLEIVAEMSTRLSDGRIPPRPFVVVENHRIVSRYATLRQAEHACRNNATSTCGINFDFCQEDFFSCSGPSVH